MTTKPQQPSTAAMEAARGIDDEYEFVPNNGCYGTDSQLAQLACARENALAHAAAIIDRHLSAERQEVREVLRRVIARGCGCGSTTKEDWHSTNCPIPGAESLLARMGGE